MPERAARFGRPRQMFRPGMLGENWTWKGKPLINFETVVNLIGGTRTRTGLKVKAVLDTNQYATGVDMSNEEIDQILKHQKMNPDWNYGLLPRT